MKTAFTLGAVALAMTAALNTAHAYELPVGADKSVTVDSIVIEAATKMIADHPEYAIFSASNALYAIPTSYLWNGQVGSWVSVKAAGQTAIDSYIKAAIANHTPAPKPALVAMSALTPADTTLRDQRSAAAIANRDNQRADTYRQQFSQKADGMQATTGPVTATVTPPTVPAAPKTPPLKAPAPLPLTLNTHEPAPIGDIVVIDEHFHKLNVTEVQDPSQVAGEIHTSMSYFDDQGAKAPVVNPADMVKGAARTAAPEPKANKATGYRTKYTETVDIKPLATGGRDFTGEDLPTQKVEPQTRVVIRTTQDPDVNVVIQKPSEVVFNGTTPPHAVMAPAIPTSGPAPSAGMAPTAGFSVTNIPLTVEDPIAQSTVDRYDPKVDGVSKTLDLATAYQQAASQNPNATASQQATITHQLIRESKMNQEISMDEAQAGRNALEARDASMKTPRAVPVQPAPQPVTIGKGVRAHEALMKDSTLRAQLAKPLPTPPTMTQAEKDASIYATVTPPKPVVTTPPAPVVTPVKTPVATPAAVPVVKPVTPAAPVTPTANKPVVTAPPVKQVVAMSALTPSTPAAPAVSEADANAAIDKHNLDGAAMGYQKASYDKYDAYPNEQINERDAYIAGHKDQIKADAQNAADAVQAVKDNNDNGVQGEKTNAGYIADQEADAHRQQTQERDQSMQDHKVNVEVDKANAKEQARQERDLQRVQDKQAWINKKAENQNEALSQSSGDTTNKPSKGQNNNGGKFTTGTTSAPQQVESFYVNDQAARNLALNSQRQTVINSARIDNVEGRVNNNSQRIDSTNKRVDSLKAQQDSDRKMATNGIAAVGAFAAVPEVRNDQEFFVGAGVSDFKGTQGIAVGASMNAGAAKLKVGVSYAGGDTLVAAGAGWGF